VRLKRRAGSRVRTGDLLELRKDGKVSRFRRASRIIGVALEPARKGKLVTVLVGGGDVDA
jgi:hypothetical protein